MKAFALPVSTPSRDCHAVGVGPVVQPPRSAVPS